MYSKHLRLANVGTKLSLHLQESSRLAILLKTIL
jgi:hypothetical protein